MNNAHVLRGSETTIMPTPTNAAQPKRLYSEMNARVIWNGPETAMRAYVQKSCNLLASTDIRLTMSPDARVRSSLDKTRAFLYITDTRPARTRILLIVSDDTTPYNTYIPRFKGALKVLIEDDCLGERCNEHDDGDGETFEWMGSRR